MPQNVANQGPRGEIKSILTLHAFFELDLILIRLNLSRAFDLIDDLFDLGLRAASEIEGHLPRDRIRWAIKKLAGVDEGNGNRDRVDDAFIQPAFA